MLNDVVPLPVISLVRAHRAGSPNHQQHEWDRYPESMTLARILLGILLALIAVVVAVPSVILVDLVSGGTGLGLCTEGLGTCTTGVFAGTELLVIMSLTLVVLAGLAAGVVRFLRWLGNRRRSVSL